MSYQNALQKYFDGELDDVGEDMLFGELAHNHDARREFNEHTKLRAAMQKERTAITPPAMAAGAIFGSLGYELPAPVPSLKTPVAGSAAAKGGMFLKLAPYALTSLFSALVAVGMYAGFAEDAFKNDGNEFLKSNENAGDKAANSEAVLLKNENDKAGISPENPDENAFNNEFLKSRNSMIQRGDFIKDELQNLSKKEEILPKNNKEDNFKTPIAVIAEIDFKNADISNWNSLEMNAANIPIEEVGFEIPENSPQPETEFQYNYSVEMRSVMGKSFPDNSVAAQSDVFKNRAVAAFYRLSDNHSIGVEAGRERFAQEFGKNINGEIWKVRQNPLYWFGGAAYRFSLADTEFFGFKNTFIPFAQIFAGAAQTGFLGKSQVGFKIVPESRIAFVLAAEGSLLLYGVDGSWNTSQKVGLSYGVNVSF